MSGGSGAGGGGPLQCPSRFMIIIKGNEIIIDSGLEPGVLYPFVYKGERYVARKINQNVIKIYEVLE